MFVAYLHSIDIETEYSYLRSRGRSTSDLFSNQFVKLSKY